MAIRQKRDNDEVPAAQEEVPESSRSSSSGKDSDIAASQPPPVSSSPRAAKRWSRWPSDALAPAAPAVNLVNIQVADTLAVCEMQECEAKNEDGHVFVLDVLRYSQQVSQFVHCAMFADVSSVHLPH